MALSLTAEQKTISEVFSENSQYIIPSYQRPYSWSEDECSKFWEDIINCFESDNEEYFLGNIIIAKDESNKNLLEVIDGQQRLITITIFLKAFTLIINDVKKLKEKIWINDEWSNQQIQRLSTQIFEVNDEIDLNRIINLNVDAINSLTKDNNFNKNFLFFYNALKEYDKKRELAKFFLEKVTLLPILSSDIDKTKAREKALKIFETINNRGLDLTDTDIFKAKLYTLALSNNEEKIFMKKWHEISYKANGLTQTLTSPKGATLDLFRIYSHILRGEQGNAKSEIGLREFFTKEDGKLFREKGYSKVIDDLNKIADVVSFYQDTIEIQNNYSELSKWFQILSTYTNQYPLWTLFVYLFKSFDNLENTLSLDDLNDMIHFVKKLIRHSFYKGSTTKIKYTMYNFIIDICKNIDIPDLEPIDLIDIKNQYFGRLKNSFALLAFYLNENEKVLRYYKFDKIINTIDINDEFQWRNYYNMSENLGNIIVIDKSKKRIPLKKKIEKVYKYCSTYEMKSLQHKLATWTYSDFKERDDMLIDRINKFFTESK